jgi:hypothetical protein
MVFIRMAEWTSPLKKPTVKKEEEVETFKKEKCVIKSGCVKKLTGHSNADEIQCRWVERWVDDLVRSNCYPPQLRSNDFYSLLGTYFDGDTVMATLEKCRSEFARAFPMTVKEKEDDLTWLESVLRSDPKGVPEHFLL